MANGNRDEWDEPYLEALEIAEGNKSKAAYAVGIHRNTPGYHVRRDREAIAAGRLTPAQQQQTFAARVERVLGSLRRGAAGVLLALVLAVPGEATVTSSPVDLGSAGLSVTVGLRRWQESAPAAWPAVSTAGVTVNDLGGGLYTVSGLPLATGTDRYAVRLSVGGVGLASYAYGAQPGVRIVWKEELELPSAPTTFKQGDTAASLSLVVRRRLPAAACEPGTTATFTAASAQTGAVLFADRAAVISNCELDATTSTYGATFTVDLAGTLTTVAEYVAEAEICYSPSSCQTVPTDNRLRFKVVKRLGG